MTRSIHPFPARMAPELAIRELDNLPPGRTVLDPMAGSGTVLRAASTHGHRAVGFDVDPLAVLMAGVWTTPVDDSAIGEVAAKVFRSMDRTSSVSIPWIDSDPETREFVNYWFGPKQRTVLRRLAWEIRPGQKYSSARERRAYDVLRLALSRIVITKDAGASLARDVSHSRPHKVMERSGYDVLAGFERALRGLRKILIEDPPSGRTKVSLGDARQLRVPAGTIDLIVTSPPYLNAIDYLRGHRLALVWLGHTVGALRAIRAGAIGTERGGAAELPPAAVAGVRDAMIGRSALTSRHLGMTARYAADLLKTMSEFRRVLKDDGRIVVVIGNSCLRGAFIRNSAGAIAAARFSGLELLQEKVRELPDAKRYLPLAKTADPALAKRMRTESVLTFAKREPLRGEWLA